MNEIIDRDLLIALPTPKDALAVFASKDGKAIEPFLKMVRDKIDAFKGDASTAAGRAAIKSMAHKVARYKVALEEVGKELADEQKAIPKRIDATRKYIKDTLDRWRDEVRAPVDAWEAAEEARINRHKAALAFLDAAATPSPDATSFDLKRLLADVTAVNCGQDTCEEYADEYALAKDRAIAALNAAIVKREKFETEQAELAALRAEKAERDRLDREADIRAQAAAEERKRLEAAANAEREAAALREAELQAARDDAERRAAEAMQRAVDEQKAKEAQAAAEAAERERDKKHRAAVNNGAVAALVAAGIDKDVAKQVVTLIAKRAVPNISIAY